MKKLLIALAAVMITAASYGQGQVTFNTRVTGSHDAPVTLQTPTGAGAGAQYSAQLFLVGAGGALTPLTPATTFRDPGTGSALLARYVVPVDVTVPGVAAGGQATLRMRAFLSSAGSFDAADPLQRGESNDITITLGGGTLPPANLTGLQGFVIPVPEPSTMALGVLGAAAMLFRRRK